MRSSVFWVFLPFPPVGQISLLVMKERQSLPSVDLDEVSEINRINTINYTGLYEMVKLLLLCYCDILKVNCQKRPEKEGPQQVL